jgi:hypothetical protein
MESNMNTNYIVFVTPDPAVNLGDVDSVNALAIQIDTQGKCENTTYFAGKIAGVDATKAQLDNDTLPKTNNEHAKLPHISDVLKRIISNPAKPDDIKIVGIGIATLEDAQEAALILKTQFPAAQVSASYMAHLPQDLDSLQFITENNIKLFTPDTLDSYDVPLGLQHFKLDTVPHTNTPGICKADAEDAKFKTTDNGRKVAEWQESGAPFAIVVLNAGFGTQVDGQTVHKPYTAAEAEAHGKALGMAVPEGTHLFLQHGGPRNGFDEKAGERTSDSFIKGFLAAQKERGAEPQVVFEPFVQGTPYNSIKASFVIAQSENCVAMISNAEGYGTMDGVVTHVDNSSRKIVGMFPFDALKGIKAREENLEKYNQKGIAILALGADGKMFVKTHPQQRQTPYAEKDAAVQIVNELGLAKPLAKTDLNISPKGPYL